MRSTAPRSGAATACSMAPQWQNGMWLCCMWWPFQDCTTHSTCLRAAKQLLHTAQPQPPMHHSAAAGFHCTWWLLRHSRMQAGVGTTCCVGYMVHPAFCRWVHFETHGQLHGSVGWVQPAGCIFDILAIEQRYQMYILQSHSIRLVGLLVNWEMWGCG